MASLDSFVLLSVLNLTNLLHLSTATNPFADHTRNPMKKKTRFDSLSIIFVIVFWFTTTNSNGNHKAMKKNPTYSKWNKKRVLFCSNNINKSQSFQFSQVLLTELSSLHACTIALLKFFQPVKRVKFVGVFHIGTCDLTQKRANTTLFSAPKAINWALTKLSIFYSRSVPGVHSKKPRCCCYRYPPCHANRDQGVVLTGRETKDVKDNYLIL